MDPVKVEGEKLAESMRLMEAARLATKKEELEGIERRIDSKLIELKKFVELTKVQGETMAGSSLTKTKEQIITEECNRMLEGTGLHI